MAPRGGKRGGAAGKATEFSLVSQYKLGYRHREDVTNLPPGVLIVGSQNVLTNVSERVQIRQGYALDGAVSSVNGPILSSFDWYTRGNGARHLRAGSLTNGSDGRLQYRYVDDDGAVTWRDLTTGLSTVEYNFTSFWDAVESLRVALFVNGTSNIFEWNGAITTIDSAAATTLTKDGTDSWLDTGFYSQTLATVGDGTTQFDISNPSGTTFRYTFDGTGTSPNIAPNSVSIGSYILVNGGNFNAANNGLFVVTGVGVDYFEVTNASGVVELNKTIDTGYIYIEFKNVVVIGGTPYGYTGGVDTTTLTGVTPSAAAVVAGSVVHQAVITSANATFSTITSTFANGLIKTMNNQVFLGSLTSSVMWLSKVNDYTDYSSSTPRQNGEGGTLILDQNLVAFNVQGSQTAPTMYVSTLDIWYNITFTDFVSATGASGQTLGAVPIKTGQQQGAQSQAMVSSMKNNTITVTNEPTIDLIGVMENYFTQIQTQNISDPIKLDVDSYDFTSGSIFYWRYYILVAVPKEGVVLLYNLATGSWEAPQSIPVSRFYIVDGELYGHSYTSFESYQLFTGYADRVYPTFSGFPIDARWVFSYQNYGSRFAYKKANALYVEGYISNNTVATTSLTYELGSCATVRTFTIDGSDTQIVCISEVQGSLGKESLGKEKLGGAGSSSIDNLPPKFRVEKTFNNTNFFEGSVSIEVLGTDQRLELIAFGLNAALAPEEPVKIRQ